MSILCVCVCEIHCMTGTQYCAAMCTHINITFNDRANKGVCLWRWDEGWPVPLYTMDCISQF
jgi:hypothetical protein